MTALQSRSVTAHEINNTIIWAYKNGITYGKTVSSFAPKDDVLRTDGITFVYRANGEKF